MYTLPRAPKGEYRVETNYFASHQALNMDGDTAVFGGYSTDSPYTDAGAVWIFVRDGTSWVEQAESRRHMVGLRVVS